AVNPYVLNLPEDTINYWMWNDITKVAVLKNKPDIARIALSHIQRFYYIWYFHMNTAYYNEFGSTDNPIWQPSTFQAEHKKMIAQLIQPGLESEEERKNISKRFGLWQQALFWTWAIELGHDEVRDVLKLNDEQWTDEDKGRLIVIMCKLNVDTVCKYLTNLKDHIRGDDVDFDQMTFAQRLRELPNKYMNWNTKNPQEVWVIKPEESIPAPQ
ncbi:hypothetical protein H4R35_007462, partial [Dimargaris xerosporica]